MKERMRTFDVPHKGIRNGLAQLSLLAGKTDYENPGEVARLSKVGEEVFLLLDTHAQDENDVSLKYLEEKMHGASHHDVEEHAKIHAAQSVLESKLAALHKDSQSAKDVTAEGPAFYTLLADFHADYLKHMAYEEQITQQLLWDNFTDEELAKHRTEIMAKLHPDVLLLWFKYVAPAQSPAERVGLFGGFKSNAPAAFFDKAALVLEEVLTEDEYNALMSRLN